MTGILVRISATAALLGALSAGTAIAQTAEKGASGGGLEEVVVTATRREERLQDVPISVSAFSQEKLDSQGLKNIDDLSRLSPGVTFSRNGTGSSANYNDENSDISIRGIDSQVGASTTAVYLDETPLQSRHIGFGAINVFPQLFDVERVEVLRGPQGTLFGAGAEGGAVRFITPSPTMVGSTGYLRADTAWTEHGDPSYELGAAMGTALVDDVLGLRVSASYRRDGGWVDRASYTVDTSQSTLLPTIAYDKTTEKAANWQDTLTLRAAMKWKASDTVTVLPSIYYQRLHINDTAIYWPTLSDPSAGQFRNGNALTNPSTDPWYLGAVKVDWDVSSGVHFVSNTSYYGRNQSATSDYTQYLRATWALYGNVLYPPPAQPIPYPNTYPQPGDAGYAPFGDQQHNFYQEFRLSSTDPNARLSWTAGVYYAHTNENIPELIYDNNLEAETGGGVCAWIGVACPNGQILALPEQRIVEKQFAGFGEIGFKFTDTLKATVGARVSRIDVDGTSAVGGAFNFAPLEPLAAAESRTSETPFTPKAVLSYQPNRDNLFYVSAAKGYRAGGVNYEVTPGCDQNLLTLGLPIGADGRPHVPLAFNSDSLWSYEIGAKNALFDHRLLINSSLFVIDWSNIQQNIYLPNCGQQFGANVGKVRSEGGDIDITYQPTRGLTFGLMVAYTDAKFTQNSCTGVLVPQGSTCHNPTTGEDFAPIVNQGDRLLGAPWTFLVNAEYAAPIAAWAGKTVYLRVDYQQTTAQTALTPGIDDRNALFDDSVPGLPETKSLSLRAGLRFSGVDVSLYANNLTNEHPLIFRSRDIAWDCATGSHCDPNGPYSTDNLYFDRGVRPRTIGLTATYRY